MRRLNRLSQQDRRHVMRFLRRVETNRTKEITEMIAEARRRNELKGWKKECWLPNHVLHDRSMKAWRKAEKWQKDAEFIDYEVLMANRPNRCPKCDQEMGDERELAIVHQQSLETGGKHEVSNIEIVHKWCHQKKFKSPEKRLSMEEFLKTVPWRKKVE